MRMVKGIVKGIWVSLLLLVAGALVAQSGLDPSVASAVTLGYLDFTGASIRQAGATAFYVRNVSLDGDAYSLVLEEDATGVWSVTEIVPEASNILPPDAILDFATISAVDGSTIRIDGVLVGSQVYGGSLSVGQDASLTLVGDVQPGEIAVSKARADALAVLVATSTKAEFDAALAQQRALLDAQITALRDERDQLAGENTVLRADKDSLEGQITTLQEYNSRLSDDITTMASEVGRLQELVTDYKSASETAASDAPVAGDASAPGWTAPGDYLKRTDLDAAAAALSADFRSAAAAVSADLDAASAGIAADFKAATESVAQELDASTASLSNEIDAAARSVSADFASASNSAAASFDDAATAVTA
ncbi:MAG: hypothetical protein E4H09_03330, partial [Spirochaetales bacterium]